MAVGPVLVRGRIALDRGGVARPAVGTEILHHSASPPCVAKERSFNKAVARPRRHASHASVAYPVKSTGPERSSRAVEVPARPNEQRHRRSGAHRTRHCAQSSGTHWRRGRSVHLHTRSTHPNGDNRIRARVLESPDQRGGVRDRRRASRPNNSPSRPRGAPYSARSAFDGSTRAARSAGTRPARMPVTRSNAATPIAVTGSLGRTP